MRKFFYKNYYSLLKERVTDTEDRINATIRKMASHGVETSKKNIDDWLNGGIEKYFKSAFKKYLGASPFIPIEERTRVKEVYELTENEVKEDIEALRKLLAVYPFRINTDGDKWEYNSDDVDSYLKDLTTWELSEDEEEYYNLLKDIANKMIEATRWEKIHGYTRFTLDGAQVTATNILGSKVVTQRYLQDIIRECDYNGTDDEAFIKGLRNHTGKDKK
jgi:hypothetical protein